MNIRDESERSPQLSELIKEYFDALAPLIADLRALIPLEEASIAAAKRTMEKHDATVTDELTEKIEAARREFISLIGAFLAIHGSPPAVPFNSDYVRALEDYDRTREPRARARGCLGNVGE